jgi:hypothetical protein
MSEPTPETLEEPNQLTSDSIQEHQKEEQKSADVESTSEPAADPSPVPTISHVDASSDTNAPDEAKAIVINDVQIASEEDKASEINDEIEGSNVEHIESNNDFVNHTSDNGDASEQILQDAESALKSDASVTDLSANPDNVAPAVESESDEKAEAEQPAMEDEVADEQSQTESTMITSHTSIELGERQLILQQTQSETGEIIFFLQGENGEQIAIPPEALSSGLVQLTDSEGNDQVIALTLPTDGQQIMMVGDDNAMIESGAVVSQSTLDVSADILNNLGAASIAIPSHQTTSTAATNVVQSIETPRVSTQESVLSPTAAAAQASIEKMEQLKQNERTHRQETQGSENSQTERRNRRGKSR